MAAFLQGLHQHSHRRLSVSRGWHVQGRKAITEDDTFTALEHVQAEKLGYSGDSTASDEALAPPQMRRSIAVYEAGRALIGSITPDYDEISKARCTPSPLLRCS